MTPATTTTSAVPTADAADQPLEYDRATVTGGVQVHRAADGSVVVRLFPTTRRVLTAILPLSIYLAAGLACVWLFVQMRIARQSDWTIWILPAFFAFAGVAHFIKVLPMLLVPIVWEANPQRLVCTFRKPLETQIVSR